ncbi:MAG TPA: S8 family peptidase [Chitinophagaceae bacterium]
MKAQLPAVVLRDSIFNKYSNNAIVKSNDLAYYIISYNEKNCTALKGIRIIRRINNSIAIIKIEDNIINLTKISCVEKSAAANDRWKLSASLDEKESALLKQKNKNFFFIITATDIDVLLASLRQKKVMFESVYLFKDAQSAVIKCDAATLFKLCLPEPGLIFADLYVKPVPDEMVIGYNRSINSVDLVDYLLPRANGDGITIGIKEESMDESDIDLQKRVLSSPLASPEEDAHATTISTLAGGAGNSFYTGKGAAWRCSFFPSSFSNLFPDSTILLLQKNVTVQNHSYGTQIQPFYGAEAVSYDMQTMQDKTLVHIFSSGNSGAETSPSGIYADLKGFANLTGNFKMAKNVISVAAVDTGGNLAVFSSAGPLYDGRLGPQITALGPNGTSEAAAIVSGSVAVLQQVYKDSNAGRLPPASLIKAVLFTTSDDIGKKGVDYRSGFGLLNLYNAVKCIQQKKYDINELSQSQVWTKTLTIPAHAANFKVSLTWTDTAARVNDIKALVNDLDLEVVELSSGTVYKPWCLSTFPNIDSLEKLPERKRDSLNTSEQVSIELPAAGLYQVKVSASQIQTVNKQPFSIAYSWDTLNTLKFITPVPEDINRRENPNLKIKWKTAVADTNATGRLSVTFNNGQSWQTIGSGIRLEHQSFDWTIPQITAIAQLRMDCSFGRFFSGGFVIAPLTRMNVDYLCHDSLRLSWQKNRLANGYQVYALGDTAFMKPISIVADTFIVLNKLLHPENIYAAKPLINGVEAARSVAVDVTYQGADCYYKTLLAEIAGDSIELTLEMSFLSGVDSIVFEKVTSAGVFIRSIASVPSVAGKFNYRSFDNSPASGANYYRAKIWIGEQFVYTEISSAKHTGKNLIFVYPNPITPGQTITFLIKESVGEGTLQVIDIAGRIIRNYPFNGPQEITTGAWSAGVYLYRIVTTRGEVKATGKFVIQ